jgi:hypothetical protein
LAFVTWVVFFGSLAAVQGSAASIAGSVNLSAADGRTFRAPGARVSLTCGLEREPRLETSDDRGEFRFSNVAADSCSVVVDLQGFKSASATALTKAGVITMLDFHLDIEPVYTGMMVTGESPPGRRGRCHTSHRATVGRSPIRSVSKRSR